MGKGIVDELKKEFDIEDTWVSFEIHPETPKGGILLSELFKGYPIDLMFEGLKRAGLPYGIKFNNADFLPNSRLSLLASEYARDKGKFHEFHEKIFSYYFTERKDIGNIDVILEAARSLGLDVDDMKRSISEGHYMERLEMANKDAEKYEITGTPTFIIDDSRIIVGAQPLEKFKQTLKALI